MAAIQTIVAKINGSDYTLTYNEGTQAWEATVSAPSQSSYNNNDGHYYPVEVTATDVAGNSTTVNDQSPTIGDSLKLRVVEHVKPVVTITSIGVGSTLTSNKPSIVVEITDNDSGVDLDTFQLKIDNGEAILASSCESEPIASGYRLTYTPETGLSDGEHTITADVSDNDENAADQASVSFTVDTTPPALNVSSPADNIYINELTCDVVGTTNDITSSPVVVTITVNSQDAGPVTVGEDGAFTKTVNLIQGANTIVVRSTDSAGKFTEVTRTVNVDTNAPQFESVTLTPNPVDAGATYIISVKMAV